MDCFTEISLHALNLHNLQRINNINFITKCKASHTDLCSVEPFLKSHNLALLLVLTLKKWVFVLVYFHGGLCFIYLQWLCTALWTVAVVFKATWTWLWWCVSIWIDTLQQKGDISHTPAVPVSKTKKEKEKKANSTHKFSV